MIKPFDSFEEWRKARTQIPGWAKSETRYVHIRGALNPSGNPYSCRPFKKAAEELEGLMTILGAKTTEGLDCQVSLEDGIWSYYSAMSTYDDRGSVCMLDTAVFPFEPSESDGMKTFCPILNQSFELFVGMGAYEENGKRFLIDAWDHIMAIRQGNADDIPEGAETELFSADAAIELFEDGKLVATGYPVLHQGLDLWLPKKEIMGGGGVY